MSTTQQFEAAMERALELALLGPAVGVNPQVGAVILDANLNIVAEGWHLGAGTPHAEVAALAKLGQVPAGATAVVTLEPCNHTGKTGPCAQALIAAGISRVVYASSDPGQQSAGGAQTLREAGVEVIGGVLKERADQQLNVWLTATKQGRPFVTLKWASSLDGRAAANDGTSKWISGPESRTESHLRRSRVDAILVGTGTVLADNPELTARKPDGSLYADQPLRVILGERDLPADARIFDNQAPTLHLATRNIHGALADLFARGVRHVWVEGGPDIASQFVRMNLVNQYLIYLAPKLLGGERTALGGIGVASMPEAKNLTIESVTPLGPDLLIVANPQTPPTYPTQPIYPTQQSEA